MNFKRYEVADRGFYGFQFYDLYGENCTIQESSLADDEAIWLGVHESRMHLNKKQVAKLIPYLLFFLKEGRLPRKALKTIKVKDLLNQIKPPCEKEGA